jgi:hypothetical protein
MARPPAERPSPPDPARLFPRREKGPVAAGVWRWLAAGLAALGGSLGLGAWLGPGLVDWGKWRPRIEEAASARLGRTVILDGRITLSLLPQPRLEAAKVAIGDEGDELRLQARAMRLSLDLGALVAGRLEPREIVILNAEIRLPWPPADLPSFRPPPWLKALDARVEDSRLALGGLHIEGVNARLLTGGVTEALVAEGSFAWRGTPVRFSGQLGRAGIDGVAPLELGMAAAAATFTVRGVLAPGGGFDGRLEAAGPDLSALVPAPALAFRATGRLTATDEVIAGDDLGLDLGGQPARGAVALRLLPAPRLDLALLAGRLDLDAWIAAARAASAAGTARSVPVGIDLSAEATAIGGVPLRRLRGGVFLEGERLTLSDVTAVLPGGTEVELAGASAGPRLELAVRFASPSLREALAALGMPLGGVDPARLRLAQGRFRLALEEGQASIADLAAEVDGTRVTGAGVVRPGPRPTIGVGLAFDRLDLDGLLPLGTLDWSALPASLAGLDLNIRLAAETVLLRQVAEAPARRAVLDATLEGGRLAVRRLGFRLAALDIALSGGATFAAGQPVRLADTALELAGAVGPQALATMLPWAGRLRLPEDLPVAFRMTASGTPAALVIGGEGDLGEARVEAQGRLDATAGRSRGWLTLRHPGAPRLLAPLFGQEVAELADWLGQGSFSLVATLAGAPSEIVAEQFDLVAGALRGTGRLSFAMEADRPRASGRFVADFLALPAFGDGVPQAWGWLAGPRIELELQAQVVGVQSRPVLRDAAASLSLGPGVLRLEAVRAGLGGGQLEGVLSVSSADTSGPPRIGLAARLRDVTIGAPVFGLPIDLGAGRTQLAAQLAARGHGWAGLKATLDGSVAVTALDGQLVGYDLPAVQAAANLPELTGAEATLRRVLAQPGGATAFEQLRLEARVADGVASVTRGELTAEGGVAATVSGQVDLARSVLDLVLSTAPASGAPAIGLRFSGPFAAPQRLPDLAPFLRWRAEQG